MRATDRACMKCQAEGRAVPSIATHIPRVLMFAFKGSAPASMFFGYPLCREHFVTDVRELVTDATWANILIGMVAAGKMAPKRELCQLEMVKLKHPDAIAFYRAVDAGTTLKVTTHADH